MNVLSTQNDSLSILNQTIDGLIQGINDYYAGIPAEMFASTSPIYLSLYIIIFIFGASLWLFLVLIILQYELLRK
jgi:hypothetical protein